MLDNLRLIEIEVSVPRDLPESEHESITKALRKQYPCYGLFGLHSSYSKGVVTFKYAWVVHTSQPPREIRDSEYRSLAIACNTPNVRGSVKVCALRPHGEMCKVDFHSSLQEVNHEHPK